MIPPLKWMQLTKKNRKLGVSNDRLIYFNSLEYAMFLMDNGLSDLSAPSD